MGGGMGSGQPGIGMAEGPQLGPQNPGPGGGPQGPSGAFGVGV